MYYGGDRNKKHCFPRERGAARTNAAAIAGLGHQETSPKQKAAARPACVAGA
jgi:hypothetical protein